MNKMNNKNSLHFKNPKWYKKQPLVWEAFEGWNAYRAFCYTIAIPSCINEIIKRNDKQ